jgi:hypothetical protein
MAVMACAAGGDHIGRAVIEKNRIALFSISPYMAT